MRCTWHSTPATRLLGVLGVLGIIACQPKPSLMVVVPHPESDQALLVSISDWPGEKDADGCARAGDSFTATADGVALDVANRGGKVSRTTREQGRDVTTSSCTGVSLSITRDRWPVTHTGNTVMLLSEGKTQVRMECTNLWASRRTALSAIAAGGMRPGETGEMSHTPATDLTALWLTWLADDYSGQAEFKVLSVAGDVVRFQVPTGRTDLHGVGKLTVAFWNFDERHNVRAVSCSGADDCEVALPQEVLSLELAR